MYPIRTINLSSEIPGALVCRECLAEKVILEQRTPPFPHTNAIIKFIGNSKVAERHCISTRGGSVMRAQLKRRS